MNFPLDPHEKISREQHYWVFKVAMSLLTLAGDVQEGLVTPEEAGRTALLFYKDYENGECPNVTPSMENPVHFAFLVIRQLVIHSSALVGRVREAYNGVRTELADLPPFDTFSMRLGLYSTIYNQLQQEAWAGDRYARLAFELFELQLLGNGVGDDAFDGKNEPQVLTEIIEWDEKQVVEFLVYLALMHAGLAEQCVPLLLPTEEVPTREDGTVDPVGVLRPHVQSVSSLISIIEMEGFNGG